MFSDPEFILCSLSPMYYILDIHGLVNDCILSHVVKNFTHYSHTKI